MAAKWGAHRNERMLPSRFSRVQLLTPWTATHQDPLPMGFSRQEYWSGLPRPPPGDLPDPGIKPLSLMCPALEEEGFVPVAPPGKPTGMRVSV